MSIPQPTISPFIWKNETYAAFFSHLQASHMADPLANCEKLLSVERRFTTQFTSSLMAYPIISKVTDLIICCDPDTIVAST
jgi:hypothetical protein